MKMTRELFEAIVIGGIETVIVKLLCHEIEWSVCIWIFVLGTLTGIIALEIICKWKSIKIYINNKYHTKIKVKDVEGFFGREKIVENIIEWYRNTEKAGIGIIYGFGGSGKTKLAQNFGKAASNYCYSIFVNNDKLLPEIGDLHHNTIIFIDYIYEYVKDSKKMEQIKEFVNSCMYSEKKIAIIFIERTNLVEYVLYALDLDKETTKKINLNDNEIDNRGMLIDIFRYRLKENDHDKIKTYVNLITNKFDPQYARPIFAHIIADLVLNDSKIDFENYSAKNKLIEEYWKYRLKRKNFDFFLNEITEHMARREDVNKLRTVLIEKAETLLLFSILTSLNIIVDDTYERKVIVQYKNGETYENLDLINKIREVLTIGDDGIEIKNIMLVQLFPTENGREEINKVKIAVEMYDIISSWLLTHFLRRTEDGNAQLISLIKSVNADVGNMVLSFVTRSAEEDNGASLLWWQQYFLLEAFDEWNEKGYEEWIKNCYELYANSEIEVQECIFNILKQFFGKMDINSRAYLKIYSYVEYLENSLKAIGSFPCIIERMNLQEPLNAQKNIIKNKGKE